MRHVTFTESQLWPFDDSGIPFAIAAIVLATRYRPISETQVHVRRERLRALIGFTAKDTRREVPRQEPGVLKVLV